jgi:Ca2+-binding EF-hand superfamily protein
VRLTAGEVLEHKFMNGGASGTPFVATVAQNLKEFCANTQFKVQVLSLMTSMLDQDELGSLKKVFQEIDTNGDGQITAEELREAFARQGVRDGELLNQVESLMKLADVNGDGVLSYEELVMTSVQRKLQNKEERLWEAFCKFDKDLDGSITASEIAEVLKVTKTEAESLIREIDKNGDNVVDYEEFVAMMMAKEEHSVSALSKSFSKMATTGKD